MSCFEWCDGRATFVSRYYPSSSSSSVKPDEEKPSELKNSPVLPPAFDTRLSEMDHFEMGSPHSPEEDVPVVGSTSVGNVGGVGVGVGGSGSHEDLVRAEQMYEYVNKVGGDDRAKWSDPDRLMFLLQCYLGSVKEGKITSFGLRKSQWRQILAAFNCKFGVRHNVEQLKNGFGNLKRQYKDTQFLREQDGWGWDVVDKSVYNTPDAWNDAIKKYPRRCLSRLVGNRTPAVWHSKALELYPGMFADLALICDGQTFERENIRSFTDLLHLHGLDSNALASKEQAESANRKRQRSGNDVSQNPWKIQKVADDPDPILSLLVEMTSILKEEKASSSSSSSSSSTFSPSALGKAVEELRGMKAELGSDFARAVLLLRDEANATIFLNLGSEDRLEFLTALLQTKKEG